MGAAEYHARQAASAKRQRDPFCASLRREPDHLRRQPACKAEAHVPGPSPEPGAELKRVKRHAEAAWLPSSMWYTNQHCAVPYLVRRTTPLGTSQMIALAFLGLVAAAAVNASLVLVAADRLTPKTPVLPLVAGNENEILAAKLAA